MHENDTFDIEIPATPTSFGADGHFADPAVTLIESQKGNIQPASGEDLMLLPEGDRGKTILSIVTQATIKSNYNIIFNGQSYKILKMLLPYGNLDSSMAHNEALITLNDTQA